MGQGDYERAEKINRESLEGRVQVLGNKHEDTLSSLGELATVLWYQGKYKIAESMNRRALSGSKKVLGVDHPDTLTSVYCLDLYYQKKEYGLACNLYHRACEGCKVSLGHNHPTTVKCGGHYSDALKARRDGS